MQSAHPTDKPTIPQVLAEFAAYEADNPTWGALHIVLDDFNVEDANVVWCIRRAEEDGDTEGARLGRLLLTMSKTQRRKLPHAVTAFLEAGDPKSNQLGGAVENRANEIGGAS